MCDLRARLACMDLTNVNTGARNGLRCHQEHSFPMLLWMGCNNHKLALCFKHLIPQFPTIFKTDAFFLSLWKFFNYHPLAKTFLEESATMYGQDPINDRACKAFYKGYKQFLDALANCYNDG